MAVEESVEQYRQWIQELLLERANRKRTFPEIEAQAVLDTERDHYLLLHTGWKDNRRTHGCSLHLDIKNGKIWIQHDGTEIGIATQLLELGVPAEDIVLGFHSPNMRQYTEFAVD
ncbi:MULTISPECIES: XisI protein [Moorena]|uniref:XisI protein n=1 Tax=Moorena producens 3L TaxID=489825 RepID=F4XVC1_9CYAN|nr:MULTISPECIES: XisI protein [Moorena]EGJ31469.1 XisI protein [Moorena producens 3L]NEP65841.1 XisI protein [Moorena sp. SIO3A5]OLT68720.1 XisI protein [Moorena producens 3L]